MWQNLIIACAKLAVDGAHPDPPAGTPLQLLRHFRCSLLVITTATGRDKTNVTAAQQQEQLRRGIYKQNHRYSATEATATIGHPFAALSTAAELYREMVSRKLNLSESVRDHIADETITITTAIATITISIQSILNVQQVIIQLVRSLALHHMEHKVDTRRAHA
jgi:hypothetical protein